MALVFGGLAKLLEEMGELAQVAGKKIAYFDADDHPDGQGSLKTRLEEERADVRAITAFLIEKRGLDADRINERIKKKLETYTRWDAEP